MSAKERPILFSAPMVRAILADTKTQTRRVAKLNASGRLQLARKQWHPDDDNAVLTCPYGQPGDRLWVRETFQPLFAEGHDHYTTDWGTGEGYAVRYVATDGRIEWVDGDDEVTDRCKSPIHMPRWASRITLEITGVRVERLRAISGKDAVAEGIDTDFHDSWHPSNQIAAYRKLWESINGPGSWGANPWVWCISFKVI